MNFLKKNHVIIFVWLITSMLMHSSWFTTIPVADLVKKYPQITYQKCFGNVSFNYEQFSILPDYHNQGNFLECFVLKIPQGKVQSKYGFVFVDQYFIQELIWGDRPEMLTISEAEQIPDDQILKLPGRVAVIAQVAYTSYSHWLNEVLGRLALLELYGIEYDWLYVPCQTPFMKETLQLWGVDFRKIIETKYPLHYIQADELIVPSLVINTNIGFKQHVGLYSHPYTLRYVRNKLLTGAKQTHKHKEFNKKVFISRKDAPWRKMTNEDEVFELLEQHGFVRYELSTMSVADQILLFNQAKIVVGEHGTGLVNCIFCQPQTKIFEIFHTLIDSSFWYISQVFNLNYYPIKTTEFNSDYMTNWPSYINEYMISWQTNPYISLESINNIIQNLPN